jgi:phosphonate transport system ATP-binding protein
LSTTILKISNLEKTFADGTGALRGASFNVGRGEFVAVLGPSGAGKTTLLRCINGLESPSGGEIIFDGRTVSCENLPKIRRSLGMIFQDFNLVGRLSVINNVLTGLLDTSGTLSSMFYLFSKEQKIQALECQDHVCILHKAHTRADHLSGGQQQRVGIARAVVKKPLLLLADEPVASLDPMIAFSILALLKDISVSEGITVLCNLHQVDLALKFADRIVGLSEGRVVMDRPVSEVDENYIRDIYDGRDKGIFYNPNNSQANSADIDHFEVGTLNGGMS